MIFRHTDATFAQNKQVFNGKRMASAQRLPVILHCFPVNSCYSPSFAVTMALSFS